MCDKSIVPSCYLHMTLVIDLSHEMSFRRFCCITCAIWSARPVYIHQAFKRRICASFHHNVILIFMSAVDAICYTAWSTFAATHEENPGRVVLNVGRLTRTDRQSQIVIKCGMCGRECYSDWFQGFADLITIIRVDVHAHLEMMKTEPDTTAQKKYNYS